MNSRRILVDLDDVCADLMTPWIAAYNKEYNDDLQVSEISNWNLAQFTVPKCGKSIYKYLNGSKLYADGLVHPVPGAIDSLRELCRYAELFIVSATLHHNAMPKVAWIKEHLPMVPAKNVIFTSRKDVVSGDILIDDGPHNIKKWNHGYGILFDQPWGRELELNDPSVAIRCHNWDEVMAVVMQVL